MIDEATYEDLSKRIDVPAVFSPKELRAFFHGLKLGRRVAHVSERDIELSRWPRWLIGNDSTRIGP